MKCQILFSAEKIRKNKKNLINLSSAESALSMVSAKKKLFTLTLLNVCIYF